LSEELLEQIVAEVQASPRYRNIHPGLVRRIAGQELAKGRRHKETVKAVRNKLHQIGGAYQENLIDYAKLVNELAQLPALCSDPDLQAFCRRVMQQHVSTRERLPILEKIFSQALAPLAPVQSLLDLACGLNPLALPWMPLSSGAPYYACDIYTDQVAFLNHFLAHTGQPGKVELCDLTAEMPSRPVQLALLLKTIPCLEQVDKSIAARLLEGIPAEHLLVSFPVSSLGGRGKGMLDNYADHFMDLTAGRGWTIRRFEFSSELAFLVSRKDSACQPRIQSSL
jgi:16S rRNA (guanine(1405)-N(7))-methyltransferase